MAKDNGNWDNRIVGTDDIAPDQLLANPMNWRVHPQFQQDVLKGVLDEVGWVQQVIVNKRTGHLIDGHLRVTLAMREDSATVPVNYVDLSEDEEKLVLATLDPLAGLAVPDTGKYADLVDGLEIDNEFISELISDIADISGVAGLTDPDEVPEVQDDPVTKVGDLVMLGNHRLLCGDATKADDVDLLLGGERANMVFTDPPYGINVVCRSGTVGGGGAFGGKKNATIGGDNIVKANKYKPVKGDTSTVTARSAIIVANKVASNMIIWGGNYFADFLTPSRGWIAWDKVDGLVGTTKNFSDIELAWTSYDKPARIFRHRWQGLLKGSEHKEKRIHPTQKPIALATECFDYYEAGGIVLDTFGGSGSTLIACEQTNRKCYMMEIDPHYCDVIVKRWENYTGQEADRQATHKV